MLTSQTEDQSFSKCSVTKCLIKIVSLPYNSGILIYLVVILGQNDSKICICTAPVKINTHGYSKIWTNPSLQLSAFILFIIHKYSLNLKSSDALLSQVRTHSSRVVGADGSSTLWRPISPMDMFILVAYHYVKSRVLSSNKDVKPK